MADQCAKILVICVGNEYREDDGVGFFIGHKLKRKNLPRTIIRFSRGEGTSLMESWDKTSRVIIIDALHSGHAPGTVYRFDAHKQPIRKTFYPGSTHHFGVAEALALAKALNRLPQSLIIYGIEGKSFKQGRGFSPEAKKAAVEVEKKVTRDIHENLDRISMGP